MTHPSIGHNTIDLEAEKFKAAQELNAAETRYRDAWGVKQYIERLEFDIEKARKAEALRRG